MARSLARHPVTASAVRDATTTIAQAETVLRAVGELPDDVDPDTTTRAEQHLITQTASFAPRDLRTLGHRVLAVVAPDVADDHERRLLDHLEAHAHRSTSLTSRALGDGTTEIRARIPDHTAERLTTYLQAFTSPRRPDGTRFRGPDGRPYAHRMGQAFVSFLEHTDPQRMPLHGGDATTVMVTIDLDTLRRDLDDAGAGVAYADDQPVSPSHVRRLACTAGIIPAVLDANGRLLDLGRTKRLFQPHQRKALALRDPTCRGQGCDIPAPWCEAHHLHPWSTGGRTDLDDGALLCSHHHHLIHDHRHEWRRQPDGRITFHRRT